MKKLRFAVGLIVVSAGLQVSPAQAATDISVGGSCKISSSWTVKASANFNNTSGSPSRGYLDYLVLRSPKRLADLTTKPYRGYPGSYESFDASGKYVGLASGVFNGDGGKQGSDWVYRIDPDYNGIASVNITAVTPTDAECTVKLKAKN